MSWDIYIIKTNFEFVPCSMDEFWRNRSSSKEVYWINLTDPDEAELANLLKALQADVLVADACFDPNATSRILLHENLLHLQIRIQPAWNDPHHVMVSIVVMPQIVLTVSSEKVSMLKNLPEYIATTSTKHLASTSYLIYRLMDRLVDESLDDALQAHAAVLRLEESLADEESIDFSQRILENKRAVAHFEINLEGIHKVVAELQALESPLFSRKSLNAQFRDTMSHLEYTLRSIDRLGTRINELHQFYLLTLQERTNRRLNTLTILSAIFLPLTLIAGIYGMNFQKMPELGWQFGYALVLGLMAFIAGTMLWFFYRNGWFK